MGLVLVLCQAYVILGKLEEAHACLARAQEIIAMPEDRFGLERRGAFFPRR